MRRFLLILSLAFALPARAQTPPKLPPCDSASVLMMAKPIFDVGVATITKSCPAFARAISEWWTLNAALARAEQWSLDVLMQALLHAPPPPPDTLVVTVKLYNRFFTDPTTGLVQGVFDDTITAGATRCIYAVARNRSGKALTGKRVVFASEDTSVAVFRESSTCPDTTVDPTWLRPTRISLNRIRRG